MATAVAVVMPAPDVESQSRQGHTTAHEEFGDERAGMGMGIAPLVLNLLSLLGVHPASCTCFVLKGKFA